MHLFDSAVTPCILYGAACFTTTKAERIKLKRVQLKMLRKIVGWNFVSSWSWKEIMRNMKINVNYALSQYPMQLWDAIMLKRKFNYTIRMFYGYIHIQREREMHEHIPNSHPRHEAPQGPAEGGRCGFCSLV